MFRAERRIISFYRGGVSSFDGCGGVSHVELKVEAESVQLYVPRAFFFVRFFFGSSSTRASSFGKAVFVSLSPPILFLLIL